jgi:4-hydroxy-tetrahydrodipicolinate synthase
MSLTGVITVIPTFFTQDRMIDYLSISEHIKNQIDAGIKTIVILGTTSETPTLSIDEKISTASIIFDDFSDKIKIIVGVSGNNTQEVINEAKCLEPYCHYMMLSAPYYNKPSQEGLYQHFSSVISQVNREFILYNVPSRCGVNIDPETVHRLKLDFSRVIGIKEASGSIEQIIKIKTLCKDFNILSGDDALTLPFMSIGAVGVISVVSNIVPEQMSYMVQLFNEGDISNAFFMFYKLHPLMKLCFIESNPVPIKYILHKRYNFEEFVRLPLVSLTQINREIIDGYFASEFKQINENNMMNL